MPRHQSGVTSLSEKSKRWLTRGMPIKQIDCRRITEPDGTISFLIQRGWPHLRALLDFMDDQFPTWNAEEMREWEQSHE
jgi:hypothetical protein